MNRKKVHLLMTLLVCIWAVEEVTVSNALNEVNPWFLLCSKFACALPVMIIFVCVTSGFHLPQGKDVPKLILSGCIANVGYFYFEYKAIQYLPLFTATIILALLPAASYTVDCIVTKRKMKTGILIPIILSLAGIAMVSGLGEPVSSNNNTIVGYISGALCIVLWVIYGYVIGDLEERYSSNDVTVWQAIIGFAVLLVFAVNRVPEQTIEVKDILVNIVLMGVLSTGFGGFIEIKGLMELGTTITGVYINILPIFTAVAGLVLLNQKVTLLQWIGGFITVACAIIIIFKTEEEAKELEEDKNIQENSDV